jgi:hypothetical protein
VSPLRRPALVDFDPAVAYVDDPVRMLRDVSFVGDEDDGIARRVEAVKQRHDLHAGLRVEVPGRLVGQEIVIGSYRTLRNLKDQARLKVESKGKKS